MSTNWLMICSICWAAACCSAGVTVLPMAALGSALGGIQQIADAGHRRVGGGEIGLIRRDVRLILRVLRDLLHQFDAVFGGRRIVARQHQALAAC